MQMIAAVDRNWAIGNRGQMLVTIPADQQFPARRPWEKWWSWGGRPSRAFRAAGR